MSEIEVVSFDAADTLFKVNWHPTQFPISMAEKYLGLNLVHEEAQEVYIRLCQGSLTEYWKANIAGEDACLTYWEDLTFTWLDRVASHAVSRQDVAKLMEQAWEDFYDPANKWFEVFDDVTKVLPRLSDMGYSVVILSNWDFTLPRLVREHWLDRSVKLIFPSLAYGVEKPDPKLFRIVEEKTGFSGREILHVGDHPVDDVQGATQAGWRALLLDRSSKSTSACVISDLGEVLQRL